mmetsp:Transcript_20546/g.48921  ORF Transcript_20546/g.48921 Transcript_20546/m.48921 type:complete len:367 (-) Transcript_20546:744-1844(-)
MRGLRRSPASRIAAPRARRRRRVAVPGGVGLVVEPLAGVVSHDLLEQEMPHLGQADGPSPVGECEVAARHGRGAPPHGEVNDVLEEAVLEQLLWGGAVLRVEVQHLGGDGEHFARQPGECVGQAALRLQPHLLDLLLHGRRVLLQHLERGCPQEVRDEPELLLRIAARKQRPPQGDLQEDAAYAPHVHRPRPPRELGEAELGRAVPSRGDVASPLGLELGRVVEDGAGEAEVADLHLAVAVHEDVARLHVAVVDVGAVQLVHPPHHLEEDDLLRLGREVLGEPNNLSEVRVHQLHHKENGCEGVRLERQQYVPDLHDVIEPRHDPEKLQLPKVAQRVAPPREHVDHLFYGDELAGLAVDCLRDDPV